MHVDVSTIIQSVIGLILAWFAFKESLKKSDREQTSDDRDYIKDQNERLNKENQDLSKQNNELVKKNNQLTKEKLELQRKLDEQQILMKNTRKSPHFNTGMDRDVL